MSNEKKYERQVFDAAEKKGGRGFKFVSPGSKGVPDRIVAMPEGRTDWIEFKDDSVKELKGLQDYWRRWFKVRGHNYYFINSQKLVDEYIQSL